MTKLAIFVLVISLLVVGFLIGRTSLLPDLTLSNDIDPEHVIAALITLIVGIFISVVFNKQQNISSGVKGILIPKILEIEKELRKLYESARAGNLSVYEAIGVCTICDKRLSSLCLTLEEHGSGSSTILMELQKGIRNYNNLLTYTPSDSLAIENGVCIFSAPRISQLRKQLNDLETQLLKLELLANAI